MEQFETRTEDRIHGRRNDVRKHALPRFVCSDARCTQNMQKVDITEGEGPPNYFGEETSFSRSCKVSLSKSKEHTEGSTQIRTQQSRYI